MKKSIFLIVAALGFSLAASAFAKDSKVRDNAPPPPPGGSGKYFMVDYPGSTEPNQLRTPVTYVLWVPDGAKQLRGVIVHQHGAGTVTAIQGSTAAYDLHWQALAKKWDCALWCSSYHMENDAIDLTPGGAELWFDPRLGSEKTFLKGLDEFAAKSGHPELAKVPWILWGHSGGGIWADVMTTLHPERVVAVWMRSGSSEMFRQRSEFPQPQVPEGAYKVPAMGNPGAKESGPYTGALATFKQYRLKGAPVGFAPDPRTGHECGDSRYLAIPYLDACMAMRLPDKGSTDQTLKPVDMSHGWLAALVEKDPQNVTAVPAAEYKGNPLEAVWLPNEAVAKAWVEYVKTGAVSDTTPPPAPFDVKVSKGETGVEINWNAAADFESGIRNFIVLRDGQELASVPEKPVGRFGRPLFQSMTFHDTPDQPLSAMRYLDTSAGAGEKHAYTVVEVNSVGLKSQPSVAAFADTNVPQAGANPIVFDQTAKTDNLVFLMAAAAEHNSGMVNANYGFPKHMWMTKFTKTTNDYLQWNVSLATGASYHVWALLNSKVAIPLRLSVEGQTATLDFTTRTIGWDKLDAGVINIPAGTHILKLAGNSDVTGNIDIKSLELVRESDRPAYETRVTNLKRYPSWFSNAKYGLMLQYGPWGYPKTGDRKSLEDFANGFDVPRFVNMVKATGASYVIWSISLITYQLVAPIKAVDDIMGNSTLTSTRDLIGEIAAGLQSNGIHFCMYYHSGLNQQPDWLAKQNWPTEFSGTGTGDKSIFFDNWVAVMSEIGNRYGTNLDGLLFDDGCNYYPAPFERLEAAARAGNPNRMISWNAWISARYTDFQDVLFGEGYHGENQFGTSREGGNGVFTDGPQSGLMGHGMFVTEGSWGIGRRNSTIKTQITLNQSLSWIKNASAHGVPLSFCMEMYEDQSYAQTTMNIFTALDSAVASHPQYAMKNNTDKDIKYSGTWTVSTGRNAGDYKDDVKSTEKNGASFEFSFTGTGVDYIAPKDAGYGSVDIYVDKVFKQTVNATSTIYQPLQTLFGIKGLAKGRHTIKGIKKDGSSIAVDAFVVCK
jgi:hypothetical protein